MAKTRTSSKANTAASRVTTSVSQVAPKPTKLLGKLPSILPWILLISGVIGIICSAFLVYDQIQVWRHPNYVPVCNLNPIVNCGTVINSKEGEVGGIPSPFLGLVTFPALATMGFVMLAGAKFKRWFWQLAELGGLGGVTFALWLFWLSLYRVHALCPFCLTVDVAVYTAVWYITLYNLSEGHIKLPGGLAGLSDFARRHHLDILIAWFLILIAYILHHFWYYFGQHL